MATRIIVILTIEDESMIMRELETFLARRSEYQPGEIDQRTRPLREKGLVPHGPRGRHAPHLEAHHVGLGILTMVARRATDSGPIAIRAMDLKPVARSGFEALAGKPLLTLLAYGLTAGSSIPDCRVHRLEILCDGSMAWATVTWDGVAGNVLFVDDKRVRSWVKQNPETYDAQGAHYCGHRFVLTEAFLDEVRLKMRHAEAVD